MNKKIIIAVLLAAVAVFSVLDAAHTGPSKKEILVRDCYGRDVSVPAAVERIGCLYAFSGHVVAMLGRAGDVVAVVRGLKRDKLLTEMYPSILNASVPGLNDSLNVEELLRVNPDIVFIKDTIAGSRAETGMLDRFGIKYLVVYYDSIESQMNAVTVIGKAINREKEAYEYNRYYRECISRVKKITAKIPENKKVRLYHSILETLKTDGPSGIAAEWTALAGTYNVSAAGLSDRKRTEGFVNIEQVLVWNPQVIITHEDGAREEIMGSRQWASIDAVKKGRIYKMPNGISRWGHPGSVETPLALLWTVKTVYPEYSSSIDIEKETRYFYEKFFNYKLSDKMLKKILYGRGMRKSKKEGSR